jgi:hypothetical protein
VNENDRQVVKKKEAKELKMQKEQKKEDVRVDDAEEILH